MGMDGAPQFFPEQVRNNTHLTPNKKECPEIAGVFPFVPRLKPPLTELEYIAAARLVLKVMYSLPRVNYRQKLSK